MHILVGFFLAALIAPPALLAQSNAGLQGRITDVAGEPLADARVRLVEAQRATVTDADGRFRIATIAAGTHSVVVSRIGYAPVVRRIDVALPVTTFDAALAPSHVDLAPVQVTATTLATSTLTSPQPTSVLEGASLRASQGASVGETLAALPGVRSLSMSTGIGKPVIRGLSSNRVVVLDDGQRLETQQWGGDHSPNVETVAADRIEVLRGPASVLYGSDALGGVINIVRAPVPDAIGIAPFLRGQLVAALGANPGSVDGTLALESAVGRLGVRASATRRATRDVRTPARLLDNTGNHTHNVDGTVGWRTSSGSAAASFAERDERIEIYEDPRAFPGFTGHQLIRERRLALRGTLMRGETRVEGALGWERNRRREYDSVGAGYVALGLLATTRTGRLNVHHPPLLGLTGTVGISALADEFEKFGRETLIPSSRSQSLGVYLFEQGNAGPLGVSAGLRFDARRLAVADDPVLRLRAASRHWRAVTGNVGVLYHLSEPAALVLNVGRGFRAPSSSDLFANGYHEGTRAFERGDPTLGVESSLNVDLALRVLTRTSNLEVGAFVNSIHDYIYLRPAGGAGRELDTLAHAQGDAQLRGFEASGVFRPHPVLRLRAAADYTRGQNLALGEPLTFIPPLRATVEARLERPSLGRARMLYGVLGGEAVAAQRRLAAGDVGTGGYSLVSLGAGFSLPTPRGAATFDVSARNVFDRLYRDFMSQYKTIAHGTGRAITLRTTVAF